MAEQESAWAEQSHAHVEAVRRRIVGVKGVGQHGVEPSGVRRTHFVEPRVALVLLVLHADQFLRDLEVEHAQRRIPCVEGRDDRDPVHIRSAEQLVGDGAELYEGGWHQMSSGRGRGWSGTHSRAMCASCWICNRRVVR